MPIGPMPEPMNEESVGRNRSPSAPVGSRLWKMIRTGLSFSAGMTGPRNCGEVTPNQLPATRSSPVPSRRALVSG